MSYYNFDMISWSHSRKNDNTAFPSASHKIPVSASLSALRELSVISTCKFAVVQSKLDSRMTPPSAVYQGCMRSR